MNSKGKKVVASIAVVGTLAAVALFNMSSNNNNDSHGNFLAAAQPEQVVAKLFSDFINK
jgi:hypothetical protein